MPTTGEILGHFGKRRSTAIKKFKSFIEEIDIAALDDLHKGTFGGFILGNIPFIKWVQKTFLASRTNTQEIPELKKLKPGVPPARIIEAVCVACKCEKEKAV